MSLIKDSGIDISKPRMNINPTQSENRQDNSFPLIPLNETISCPLGGECGQGVHNHHLLHHMEEALNTSFTVTPQELLRRHLCVLEASFRKGHTGRAESKLEHARISRETTIPIPSIVVL